MTESNDVPSGNNLGKKSGTDIICYNCLRNIDISGLEEGTFFKCKNCYTTLIVADYFQIVKEKLLESRNRWGLIGLIIGLAPMLVVIGLVTIHPFLFLFIFILLNLIIVLSLFYFKKRANDIILGIIFSELGIYANITSIVLTYFTIDPFKKNVPDLSLQIYLFLISGSFLILWGLSRRKNFLLK